MKRRSIDNPDWGKPIFEDNMIHLDKSEYRQSETIRIKGRFNPSNAGAAPVQIIVHRPSDGEKVAITTTELGHDNFFDATITAGNGAGWIYYGTYKIRAYYEMEKDKRVVSIDFEYTTLPILFHHVEKIFDRN